MSCMTHSSYGRPSPGVVMRVPLLLAELILPYQVLGALTPSGSDFDLHHNRTVALCNCVSNATAVRGLLWIATQSNWFSKQILVICKHTRP